MRYHGGLGAEGAGIAGTGSSGGSLESRLRAAGRPGPGSQREGRAGMAGQAAEVRRGNGGEGRRPAGRGVGGCSAELPSAWPEGGPGGCPQGALLLGHAGVNKGSQSWVGSTLSCPSFHAISMLSENTA